MEFNFKEKLEELKKRKYEDDLFKGELVENFTGNVSDAILYISEAMRPVGTVYTENTYKQCDKVKSHLLSTLKSSHGNIQFEYQGSVPLNVHIKRHSDVDLLVATGNYFWIKEPLPNTNPYYGNPSDDLLTLREGINSTIRTGFPAVEIDNSGGKAVEIQGGSLNRKIDLVPCSWVHNTSSYYTTDLTMRGIRIFDKKQEEFIENYPFLHIANCERKDISVGGKFKKLVRYIKNIIKDSDGSVDISSYDATSLIFQQSEFELNSIGYDPASLSLYCEAFLLNVLNNVKLQEEALVPNRTRKLFGSYYLKINEVEKLYQLVSIINQNLKFVYSELDFTRRRKLEEIFKAA